MWMPPRHTENAAHAEPDPRSPWQAATALLLIAAFALLITGATQACAPRAATPLLSSTAEPDTGLTRTNPRLSEMIDALSRQTATAPITFTAETHLANRNDLRRHAHAAALNQGWYPVPRGHANPPDTFIVPQKDLPILESIEQNPLERLQELSSGPPRQPSSGPLVTTRLRIGTYITPTVTSKLLIATGAVLFILTFAAAWALTQNPRNTRRT